MKVEHLPRSLHGEFRSLLIVCTVMLLSAVTSAQTSDQTARKFDEFGDIYASDLIARLDNFAIAIHQEPGSKAFLVVYRTRRDLPGLSNRYAHRMKAYLINSRGLPAQRVIIVDGGVANCLSQELWIAPLNSAPKPREDAYDNSYKPSLYKFDEHDYKIGKRDADWISYWPNAPENLIGYLESFGEMLLKDRKLIAYLVAFRGEGDQRNVIQRMLQTERKFLLKEFGINPARIKTLDGGYRESPMMELWLARPGYRPVITSYRAGKARH